MFSLCLTVAFGALIFAVLAWMAERLPAKWQHWADKVFQLPEDRR